MITVKNDKVKCGGGGSVRINGADKITTKSKNIKNLLKAKKICNDQTFRITYLLKLQS